MELTEAIVKIRPVVLQFTVAFKGTHHHPFGSGFVLDKLGHIATAAHVVRDAERFAAQGHRVTIGFALANIENKDFGYAKGITIINAFHQIEAEPMAIDDANDVAVLRMNPNLFKHPPRSMFQFGDTPGPLPLYEPCCISNHRPRDGERIAVSGYPLSSPTLITTAGNIASGWASQTRSIQNGTEVIDVYLADISVNPGNSGGPAYRLEDGFVIGVCTAYRTAPLMFMDATGGQALIDNRPVGINSGLCVVAPISNVENLLAKVLASTENGENAI